MGVVATGAPGAPPGRIGEDQGMTDPVAPGPAQIVRVPAGKARYLQSVGDIIRSMAVIGGVVLLLATFIWLTRRDSEQVVREVDWRTQAIVATAQTDLPILVPAAAASWTATSAGVRLVDGQPTWAATFLTDGQAGGGAAGFIGIVVSAADESTIRDAYLGSAPYEPHEIGQRDGATVLVYGTADAEALARIAAGLTPVTADGGAGGAADPS